MWWLGRMASGIGAAVTDVSRGSQAAGTQDPSARWSLVETRQVQLVRRSPLHSDLLQLSMTLPHIGLRLWMSRTLLHTVNQLRLSKSLWCPDPQLRQSRSLWHTVHWVGLSRW